MESVINAIAEAWNNAISIARSFTLKDAADILLVAVLLYGIIKLVRETRAGQLVKGIILLLVLFLVSYYLDLMMLNAILQVFIQSAFIVVVILFQPEIRNALEKVGRNRMGRSLAGIFGRNKDYLDPEIRKAIDSVVEGVSLLQQLRMGALIVFERDTKLGEIAATGTVIEAEPSAQIIGNIFFNKAPLHDGAMIIRGGKIYAAGCILPLTSSVNVSAELGTRHRAAIGMSENSDAVIVVVSEETAQISIALGGRLRRDYNRVTLLETLEKLLTEGTESSRSSSGVLSALRSRRSGRKGG